MNARAEPVLSVRGLTKRFRARGRHATALENVNFEVHGGGVTGLIGPDGAGKTTLMRLAAGLLEPDSGQIRELGHDATRESAKVQLAIGYMPQRFGLYEDLSVQENLDLYADLQGVLPSDRKERYRELLDMTGLAPFRRRLCGRLSGGMKQKMGLACTLVKAPRLLLLDEPTVGVDPVSRRELWTIVYRLVAKEAMSVLLSTAYLDEAERCAHLVLLHEGRVIGEGSPEDFSRPMRGRTFHVRAPQIGRRRLQTHLALLPGVLDVTLDGDAVRVVTESVETSLSSSGVAPEDITAVAPRFEDGFIARLRRERPLPTLRPQAKKASPMSNDTVIAVRSLSRRFGDFLAVKNLSFSVGTGEIFGLLGANGAGKTTTFRMLCGLLPASGGQLQVAGVDLRTAPASARARIGYMSQKFSQYGNLTVRQNLEFFAKVYGLSGAERALRLGWALQGMGLAPYATAESAELPLGFKQRLALSCALLHQPDILFLDEPTSGVDPLARRAFWSRINALAETGVTVLITTHFMEEAEYCDRLAIMASGEILALGTPQEVKARAGDAQGPASSLEVAFLRLVQAKVAA
jgi:ABC-2 type transport system ATP-binding protein